MKSFTVILTLLVAMINADPTSVKPTCDTLHPAPMADCLGLKTRLKASAKENQMGTSRFLYNKECAILAPCNVQILLLLGAAQEVIPKCGDKETNTTLSGTASWGDRIYTVGLKADLEPLSDSPCSLPVHTSSTTTAAAAAATPPIY